MWAAFIAFLLTAAAPGGYTAHAGRVFGPGERDRLDVYEPRGPHPGAPVVVFFYGGNWDSGSRGFYRFVGAVLASRGVVAVIPDYRVYPEVRFPDFLNDSARAVAWAKAHAADYGGDPRRLFLMGHSAGAYNAAMLTVDRRWLGAVGLDPRTDVAGVVGLAGPYDFLPLHSERLKAIFGPPDQLPDTQPITHVDGQAPPMLLLTGDLDDVVDPGNSDRLAARVVQRGGQAGVRHYPQKAHISVLLSLLPVFGGQALADASDFIQTGARPVAAQAAE